MPRRLGITVRINAAQDTVSTGDHALDRSRMTKPEKRKLTRMIREIYSKHLEGN